MTEARGVDGFYGCERLVATLGAAMVRRAGDLLSDVRQRPRDDVAVLVLKVTAR